MTESKTTFHQKFKHWFRRFSWRAGVGDAIACIYQEQKWANGNNNKVRDLEMQYAANSLRYLLNRGYR